jgi:hypothetical protein
MTDQPVFTPRLLAAWIAAATLTFVLSIAFMLHGETTETVGPGTFSRSALGHEGIADILRQRGVTVLQSQGDSLHKLGRQGVLVLAEPELGVPSDSVQRALLRAPTVLLVLPKWLGQPDRRKRGWIEAAEPLPVFVPQSILDLAIGGGRVVRSDEAVTWTRNEIGPAPHLTTPVQLVRSDGLRPIVGSEAGMLLGERRAGGQVLWVLSDPDVIANHGLGDGNAAFAVALFDALRAHGAQARAQSNPPAGVIVFDETVHGFTAVPPNPAALLVHKPFAQIGIQALCALALLLWAGAAPFGAPEVAPPPLKAGKRDLVRNIADLFGFAGHQPMLVRRYVEETIRDVTRRLHTPQGLAPPANLGWLQRVGADRGVSVDIAAVSARAEHLAAVGGRSTAELARLPREIWQWKQEMVDGFAGSAGDRGGHPRGSPQGRGGAG